MLSNIRNYISLPLLAVLLWMGSCKSSTVVGVNERDARNIPVDSTITSDPYIDSLIAPYKEKLDEEMNRVVGHAAKELTKGPVESTLGNFVADLTEEKASEYAGYEVDMGAVTIGGLRVPIPEGPVRLIDLYELLPFENMIWILELKGDKVRQLFEYAAENKNIAISSSRLVVENGEPVSIEINGEPFDPSRTYTLAISDYLASGGDDMAFLKDARIKDMLEVKVRDAIIEKVRELEAAGQQLNAEIEGRVVIHE